MEDQIGTFIVVLYIVVWLFTALYYEGETGEEKAWQIWLISFFWPLLIAIKMIKK